MHYLFIVNDSPYGSQRTYNALRLATALQRKAEASVRVFLFGDGVTSALAQATPLNAFYNPQEMLNQLASGGAELGACKTCLEQRGLGEAMILPAVKVRTLDDLTEWTQQADKVLTF